MYSKVLSAAAVALAASQLASAQTFTNCNPQDKKCPDNPAVGGTEVIDFTKGPSDFFTIADGTKIGKYDATLGAEFTINKEGEAPTITAKKYIFFGNVQVITRACYGTGVVSSVVLQSDNLDEIDWEWLGGDRAQVQTNYFGKGDTSTYDRGAYHPVNNPQDNFYNYTIDWTPDYVRWYIDGKQVRQLLYADAKGGATFPQTPAQLKLGNWVAGGKDSPKGTVEWAGGYTDFSQAPFHAYYKTIVVTDYHKGATSYVWPEPPAGGRGDGSWKGIKVVTGGSTGSSSSSSASASASSKPSGTSASASASATYTTKSNATMSTSTTGSSSQSTGGSSAASSSGGSGSSGSSATSGAASGATSAPARPNGAYKQGLELSSVLLAGAGVVIAYLAL